MKRKPIPTNRELIPLLLRTPAFLKAWAMFEQHRKEKNAKLTPTAARLLLKKLEDWGEPRAIAALQHSIENGWTGVFEPKDGGRKPSPPAQPRGGW